MDVAFLYMDNLIGYPNPNSYRIYLNNPLTNVVSINMESTEFTNTSFKLDYNIKQILVLNNIEFNKCVFPIPTPP